MLHHRNIAASSELQVASPDAQRDAASFSFPNLKSVGALVYLAFSYYIMEKNSNGSILSYIDLMWSYAFTIS